jgi:hypothetical protein
MKSLRFSICADFCASSAEFSNFVSKWTRLEKNQIEVVVIGNSLVAEIETGAELVKIMGEVKKDLPQATVQITGKPNVEYGFRGFTVKKRIESKSDPLSPRTLPSNLEEKCWEMVHIIRRGDGKQGEAIAALIYHYELSEEEAEKEYGKHYPLNRRILHRH